ncbi:MAG: C40 family peptidase, partial [Actinomycetota bacterium]
LQRGPDRARPDERRDRGEPAHPRRLQVEPARVPHGARAVEAAGRLAGRAVRRADLRERVGERHGADPRRLGARGAREDGQAGPAGGQGHERRGHARRAALRAFAAGGAAQCRLAQVEGQGAQDDAAGRAIGGDQVAGVAAVAQEHGAGGEEAAALEGERFGRFGGGAGLGARRVDDLEGARVGGSGGLEERQDLLASLSGEISAIIQRREAARRAEAERLAAAAGITLEEAVAVAGGDDVALGGSADIGSAGAVIEAPPSSTVGGSAASIALGALGIPYVWAGSSPEGGFDCSGLIMWAYAQVGVSLPHNAAAIYGTGTPVPLEALEPGDIISFRGSGHAGIYIGGGQYVHAPQTGDVVKVSSLSDRSDIDGAVRVS